MNMHVKTRKKASDFDQELLDLYDAYCHGKIDRRQFLDGAAKFAVGGVTAAALVNMLLPDYALAQQVKADDPRIKTQVITYDSPKGHGKIKGLLAKPAAGGKRGSVVVVHENRGLNPYIEDVARRLAVAGFNALAPDGLSPLGGYPGNDDQGRQMQAKLDASKLLMDFAAAYEYLKADADSNGKVGVVGFCFGGGIVNAMAVMLPELAAGVSYYGRQANADDVPRIRAPLMIHYGELDKRINDGWPAFEAALKAHNKSYETFFYLKANHGFHNDTTPRYDKEQGELSWKRSIEFFAKHLN